MAKFSAFVLAILAIPGIASAHPGHGDHGVNLDPQGALVVVGLTIGVAIAAWEKWGKKRPATDTATTEGGQS